MKRITYKLRKNNAYHWYDEYLWYDLKHILVWGYITEDDVVFQYYNLS